MGSQVKKQDKNKMFDIDESITRNFEIRRRLGKGAYGIVWKATSKRNNETVALKKIFDAFRDETDAQRTFREVMFLKAFRYHPNIVELLNVYKASNNLDIYLVFEYMDSDLHNIIKKGSVLQDVHKRFVMYQLINAVRYIHSGNVIHRDLKPSNVLIDNKCRCKLADFGLARSLSKAQESREDIRYSDSMNDGQLLTDYVATRWYRAPEILVASKQYTKGIDMWSLGCILGEMLRGKPLFQGSCTVDQIEKIVSAMPAITEEDIKAVGAGFGSALLREKISLKSTTTLDELLAGSPPDALDMAKCLMVLDPFARLTASECLNHRYVEKFRNSINEKELHIDVVPPFRDDVRLTVTEYRAKLYEVIDSQHGSKLRSLNSAKALKARTYQTKENGVHLRVSSQETLSQVTKKPSRTKYEEKLAHMVTGVKDKYTHSSEFETAEHNGKSEVHRQSRHHAGGGSKRLPPTAKAELSSKQRNQKKSYAEKILPNANREYVGDGCLNLSHKQLLQQQQYKLQVDQLKQQKMQLSFPYGHHNQSRPPSQHLANQPSVIAGCLQKPLYEAEDRVQIVVPRSKQQLRTKAVGSDESIRSINLEKRHSIDGGYQSLQDISQLDTTSAASKQESHKRLTASDQSSWHYRSTESRNMRGVDGPPSIRPSPALSRCEMNLPPHDRHRSNSMMTIKAASKCSLVRPVHSTTTQYAAPKREDGEHAVCYQTRLNHLENEIENYKRDVKIFCKETYENNRLRDESSLVYNRQKLKKSNSNLCSTSGGGVIQTTAAIRSTSYKNSNGPSVPPSSGFGRGSIRQTCSGNDHEVINNNRSPMLCRESHNQNIDCLKGSSPSYAEGSGDGCWDLVSQKVISPIGKYLTEQQRQQQQEYHQQQQDYRAKPLSKFLKKTQLTVLTHL